MLNYHRCPAVEAQRNEAHFVHFFSTGSCQSPYQLKSLLSFSIVKIFQHTNFPILENNYTTLVIPLLNQIKVNSVITKKSILNPTNIGGNQVQQNKQMSKFLFLAFDQEKGQTKFLETQDKQQFILYESQKIRCRKYILNKNKQLELNKISFIFIESGRIKILPQNQQFLSSQAFIVPFVQDKNRSNIEALQDTIMWQIEIL